MTEKLLGKITYEPDLEGKTANNMALVGNVTFRDGVATFEPAYDYHFYRDRGLSEDAYRAVNRYVPDREKYPSWPNPEPT